MYLLTAATGFEMKALEDADPEWSGIRQLVTGIGPVETTLRLTRYLAEHALQVRAVINFGVAGAYIRNRNMADLVDICLAEQEVLGDFGVCLKDGIERFDSGPLATLSTFAMDGPLLSAALRILTQHGISWHSGTFITVNCASGTLQRGHMLAVSHDGLCENMEGAAVARVCQDFSLPCLEIRCISNLVEDRDTKCWQLNRACAGAGRVAALLTRHLVRNDE